MRRDAILAGLLPGDGPWPAADRTGVPGRVAERAEAALARLEQALPAGFEALDPAGRAEALAACETVEPAAFAAVLAEAYAAYYSDPAVLAVIEATTGFPARPPQPLGYELPATDWSILESRRMPRS